MNFEQLVTRISPTLKKITIKLNGHHKYFDDDDLSQEALSHLWISYQDGKLEDKTDSYILQNCYFYLKNYIRKEQDNTNSQSLDSLLEEGQYIPENFSITQSFDSSRYINEQIFFDSLQINNITEREKEIISLCLENLTLREIGRRLGISHVMVIKIIKGLRKKLEPVLIDY